MSLLLNVSTHSLSDLSADWMSSVITTSVVTSAVMTPGSAEGEEQRPASHPGMSQHMRPPTYPTTDPHLDPAVEAQFVSTSPAAKFIFDIVRGISDIYVRQFIVWLSQEYIILKT